MAIPKYDELFNPVLQALHDLGLGVTVSKRIVEDVEIKPEWFQAI